MIKDKIKRWWQGHGFGIESKTDFDFLHDILKEETPYYAYEEWKTLFPDASDEEMKLARLLMRLCNSIQPTAVHIYGEASALTKKAVADGCRNTDTIHHASPFFRFMTVNIRSKIKHGTAVEILPHRMDEVKDCVAIVLSHINSHNAMLWEEIVKTPIITYDMRSIGIAVMRKGRFPEHYNI